MLLVKPSTVVVLSLLATSRAVPYDSYPTYPTNGVETTSATSTSDDGNDSNKTPFSSIGDGLQRVWEGITCMSDCRQTWGWTGNHFGGDPWGGVLQVGDPMPYDNQDSNANANASSDSGSPSATATSSITTTSSDSEFGIPDITTTAASSVTFSVFNVPTLQRTTSTTSSTTTSTPPPPPPTSTPEPSPTPEPQTTQQPQPQPDPTTNTPDQPAPTDNSNNNQPAPTDNNNNNQPAPTNNNSDSNSNSASLSADQAFFVSAHNDARAAHGASPVTYSFQLEGFAQQWASNCQFQHSGGKFGRVGENLAAGTGNYGFADAMAGWMAEVSDYDPSNPVASHFTQVVWKGTTQIGCALAVCGNIFPGFGNANYYVCEYLEAGNVSGQFGANVQK